MSVDFHNSDLFRLGEFLVDPVAGTLSHSGQVVQLQPKVMQLLVCLAENHGQIVSKEYLLEHVWPGTFVVDGALRRCVYLLRKAMSSEDGESSALETLPRRGYRLLLAPEKAGTDTGQAPVSSSAYRGDAYRGLQQFDEAHAEIFFGRSSAVSQVVAALDAQVQTGHGFCLILGPSGSGKSSLAMAGVLPALTERARKHGDSPPATINFKISDSPNDPLGCFAAKIVAAAKATDDASTTTKEIARKLKDDEDDAVSSILQLWGDIYTSKRVRLIMIFDQFEELLSTHHVSDQIRDRLVAVLYQLVRSGAVWMIATMRSEFYPLFTAVEALRFLRGEHGQIDLPFPGAAEIADIVRKPAALAGLSFETDADNRRLDQIIIDDASRQDNCLPLLQFALRELEMKSADKVLRLEDYRQLGKLEGCLSGHADRVFNALPAKVQAALPSVLERMVIADPRNAGRILKRTVPMTEFGDSSSATTLVKSFVEARLVTSFMDEANGTPSVQFAHEAVLANWARSSDWVQANYAEIRFRSWLSELATRWHDDGRLKHYLLNDGKPLLEATRLAERKLPLTPVVRDFVRASNRRASRRDMVRGAVSVMLVALTLASLVLWRSALRSSEAALSATQRAESTSDFLLSMFENSDPGNTGGVDLTAPQLLDRARDQLNDTNVATTAADRAALLSKLGETYMLIGQYDTADALFSQAQALLQEIEDDHPDVAAKVLLELGAIRKNQQQFEQSDQYLRHALELSKSANNNVLVAHCLNILGLLEHTKGDFAQANVHFRDALVALDKAPENSREAIKLRPSLFNNQGAAHLALNQPELASAAFQRAISMRREHNLHETAEQTDVIASLGNLRESQGRHEEAIEHFADAIELRTRLHGPHHPHNAFYLVNKSSAEMKLARFDDARKSARDGLKVVESGAGYNKTLTALLHANYAISSWQAGDVLDEQALDAAAAQVDALGAAYGEDHAVIDRLRAAIAGQRIDGRAYQSDLSLEDYCRQLSNIATRLPSAVSGSGSVGARLHEYFNSGHPCASER